MIALNKIPIIQLKENLMISIQDDIYDEMVISLQNDILDNIRKKGSKGLIIDISALNIVDSFIGRTLGNIASMAKLMGARTVLVGVQPEVAITMVELGLELGNISTAKDVDKALKVIGNKNAL